MTEEQYNKLMDRLKSMDDKINPMYEVFTSVNGFNRVAITIIKMLAAVGAALVGLYALMEFVKKIAK